jgi:retron-type reverse transcriptase
MQEVVRQLLDAYFEPCFSDHSHGFRPGRGCHTALSEIVQTWKGVHWYIEARRVGTYSIPVQDREG